MYSGSRPELGLVRSALRVPTRSHLRLGQSGRRNHLGASSVCRAVPGRVEFQPCCSRQKRPRPVWGFRRWPRPVPGYIDPSSAKDRAPNSVRSPPSTHTHSTGPSESTWAAMELGSRKIPEPMIVPTTTAHASKTFNSLRRPNGETELVSPGHVRSE